jgi:hypothetical protein
VKNEELLGIFLFWAVLFIFVFGLARCSDTIVYGCKVTEVPEGHLVQCGQTTTIVKDGVDGEDGIDFTGFSIVKLCPGSSVYPSTFVEIAFCYEDTLYATYSANGGFSTEIPPGTYSSAGINSSCTFTVLEGCEVVW